MKLQFRSERSAERKKGLEERIRSLRDDMNLVRQRVPANFNIELIFCKEVDA